MKSQDLILSINIQKLSPIRIDEIAIKLSRDGWVISSMQDISDCLVYVFESENDQKEDRIMCYSSGHSFDYAFSDCLRKIQDFYKRNVTVNT